jgi:hypothetical protein
MNYSKLYLYLTAILIATGAYSQTINSPYSSNGIGELAFQGLPQNYSMGEVGIATASSWHINLLNPALLTYNTFSSFQVGLEADVRKSRTETQASQQSGLSLRYLAMSMPFVSKSRWVSSFALLPLSSVNYHTSASKILPGDLDSKSEYYGDGGLTQVIWANGFRITPSLNIGFKAAYVFGSITNRAVESLIIDSISGSNNYADNFVNEYKSATAYSDYQISFGAAYRFKISDEKSLQLGMVSDLSQNISGSRTTSFQTKSLSGSEVGGLQIIKENQKVLVQLPLSYGVGISFDRWAHYKFGLDVKRQNWGSSKTLEPNESYRNTNSISIGGEWIPNYQSIKSYMARATYRVGFSYKELPYLINATKIDDFGINFGTSLPMTGASNLELAFKVGVRGTTKNNLIRENYFQFVLGATINDRWFIKRRYD